MARNRKKVEFQLNSGAVVDLPMEDIKVILRAADELINTGGRNMLVKILKGSKDKKLLEHELDQCPVYGYYHDLKQEEISARVDWMLKEDYLRISYSGRLPMLIFSEKGWEIEKETFAEELFQRLRKDAEKNEFSVVNEMEHVNRQGITDLLEKVRQRGDSSFIPQLDIWKAGAVKKVKTHIESVEKDLSEVKKIAVLFPGIGYTCDKPLLYYSTKLCMQSGYRVVQVPYGGFPKNIKGDPLKMRQAFFSAYEQSVKILHEINWDVYEEILFVGKSIGTAVGAHYAKSHHLTVRSIHFTPLEETFSDTEGEAIVFHGTADPWAKTDEIRGYCEKEKMPLYLTENANHSLETGNVRTDLETLRKVFAVVEEFLREKSPNATEVHE